MTKIYKGLFLVVALVAIGAASYGLARAYFDNIETPATSTADFKAGTIAINIQKHEGYNEVPFQMENWMPGQTQAVVFDVVNTSTVPVNLVGAIDGTWGGELGDQKVYVLGGEYWDGSAWANLTVDSHGNLTFVDAENGKLAAGKTVTFRLTAKFDETAGNDFQGQTYHAAIRVVAVQVGGELPTSF